MLESSSIQLNVFHTNCILSPFRELNDGVSRIVPAQEKFESEMRYFSRNAWKNPTDVFSCLHYLQCCRLRYAFPGPDWCAWVRYMVRMLSGCSKLAPTGT